MRSNLLNAVLAARAKVDPGSLVGEASRSSRSLDRVWAALSQFERAQLEREVDGLAVRGVRAALLGGSEPLFYSGPLESAGSRVLAVCGPREAGADAVGLARRAAETAADTGVTVLTGDTEGLEAAASRAALDRGGLAVSVLAEGFTPASTRPAPGLVAVTPCAPGRPWSVESAMARNTTIAGLCTALVAICAGSTGATLDVGMRALAAGRPVLAVGATAGTRLLVDYGATAATDEVELAWWLQTRAGTHLGTGRPHGVTTTVAPAARPASTMRTDRVRGCEAATRPAAGSRPSRHRAAPAWSTG